MKLKKNSLKVNIWFYLILFSFLILIFLWLFQIIFINSFYERTKINDLNNAVNTIKKMNNNSLPIEKIDDLSRDKELCIQIISSTSINIVYDSSSFNRGCLPDRNVLNYKQEFILSNLNNQTYKLVNPRYDNEVFIKALKLDEGSYLFVSTSLVPLSRTISILKNQLFIVSFVVLILSFLIAYFISKKLSKPIEEMNISAKKMASGDYETKFYSEGEIDELNELSNTLNDMRVELGKSENLRRELMANVGHDLKTPLTMIRSYAEMVRDLTYKDRDKMRDNLNVIIDESERLNLLVNDILDLSVMQSGTLKLEYSDFDINILINDIIKRFDILTEKEKYDFIFTSDKEIIVHADKKKIYQAIYNLVNNAINYTGKDKKVIINITSSDSNVRIEIKDTGKGIKDDNIKLIWKKYYKVDKHYNREKIGTGIGLSIVESIFISHKFKYGVESTINKGTTFWFEIPK